MTTIESIRITDEHGTSWTEQFANAFDFTPVTAVGEGLGERGHGDLFTADGRPLATREDVLPLIESILTRDATERGWAVSIEWSEPFGAFLIGWYDGTKVWTDAISDDGEGHGYIEFSTLVWRLGLTVAIEWTPTPELPPLTRTQLLAADNAGGMFNPQQDSAHHVSFVDVPDTDPIEVGVGVSAGWSPLDPRTKLIIIDTEIGTGGIRVLLNDAPIFEGDPEQ